MTIKKAFFLASLLALGVAAQAADKATVAGLLKDGKKYDKKAVIVRGKVEKFTAKTSRSGNPYFLFKLTDAGKFVSVYGQGKLAKEPKDGDTVEVTGEFAVERTSGSRTYKNELDASSHLKPTYVIKLLKK